MTRINSRTALLRAALPVLGFLLPAVLALGQVFQPVVKAEHGFEGGVTHGWVPRGNAGAIKLDTVMAHGGRASLYMSGRSLDWHMARVELTNLLDRGAKYHIELWMRPAAGVGGGTMNLTVMTRYPERDVEASLSDDVAVSDARWTKLEGEFVFDPAAASAYLYPYFRSNPTAPYYVDDLKVTKIADKAEPEAATLDSRTYDFEGGQVQGWAPRGGGVLVASVAEAAHSGAAGLSVTGRGEAWHGPSLDMKELEKGAVYEITGYVRLGRTPSGSSNLKFTMEERPAGRSTGWKTVAEQAATNTQWVKLSGQYTYTTDMDGLLLYAESSNASDVIHLDDVTVAMVVAPPAGPEITIQRELTALRDALRIGFTVGAAVEPYQLAGVAGDLLQKHFNVIVAENVMKMDAIQPVEGSFNWADADKIIDFATANGMLVRYHTLQWHSQVPSWLFLDSGGKDMTLETNPVRREANKRLLLQRLETHITAIMTRYGARVWSWDVVNEVIDANGPGGLRENKWYQITGRDYIETAFRTARAVGGPRAKLYITDYSTHDPAKRDVLYAVVQDLLARGVPIDGVGHQTHIRIDSPSVAAIGESIRLFGGLGLDNQLTELDVSVYPDDVTAYPAVPQEVLGRQGWRYREIFAELMKQKDSISNVTFWGIADNHTWLHNRPIPRRDAPFAFDEQYQAKPAYWGIVDPTKLPVLIQEMGATRGTPTVDGGEELSWNVAPWVPAQNGSGPATRFRTLWDERYLHVLADVRDTTRSATDAVDVFVDTGDRSAAVDRTGVTRLTLRRGGAAPAGATVRVTESAQGYLLEASITLPAAVASGGKVGFDLRATDGANASQVSWNDATHGQNTDASRYGTLALKDAIRLAQAVRGTPRIDATPEPLWDTTNALTTEVAALGTRRATATVRTLWDESYLYVLAQVTDPLLNKASANAYEQDSVEFFLDENLARTNFYQADDVQVRVNFEGAQSFGSNGADSRFVSASRTVSGGYVVEAAIPFKTVRGPEGLAVGFDAQVNDADASGRRVAILKWNDPTDNSYRDTSGLGVLVLSARR